MKTLQKVTAVFALVGAPWFVGACSTPTVQAYDGPKLPDDKVTFLWTNPHLEIAVDRQYTVPEAERAKLQKVELRTGHHVVEVSCLYSDDVPWNPKPGVTGAPARDKSYTKSGTIALTMDGEPGHSYKPVARFEVDAAGTPGCHVKLVDVTESSGVEKTHLY